MLYHHVYSDAIDASMARMDQAENLPDCRRLPPSVGTPLRRRGLAERTAAVRHGSQPADGRFEPTPAAANGSFSPPLAPDLPFSLRQGADLQAISLLDGSVRIALVMM